MILGTFFSGRDQGDAVRVRKQLTTGLTRVARGKRRGRCNELRVAGKRWKCGKETGGGEQREETGVRRQGVRLRTA